MRPNLLGVLFLELGVMHADVFYDFETPGSTPSWIGTVEAIQNTNASHSGTNAIAFSGTFQNAYLWLELPDQTTRVDFSFFDEFGSTPPLYRYMKFWLAEDPFSEFAGFSMLDGGWGTTPPMAMNHYYAFANEEYSLRTMGPVRTVGWHKFTFALGAGCQRRNESGGKQAV